MPSAAERVADLASKHQIPTFGGGTHTWSAIAIGKDFRFSHDDLTLAVMEISLVPAKHPGAINSSGVRLKLYQGQCELQRGRKTIRKGTVIFRDSLSRDRFIAGVGTFEENSLVHLFGALEDALIFVAEDQYAGKRERPKEPRHSESSSEEWRASF